MHVQRPVFSPSLSSFMLVSPQSVENIITTYFNALASVVLIFRLYFQVREWVNPWTTNFPSRHTLSVSHSHPSTSQFIDVVNFTFLVFYSMLYLTSYILFSYFLNFSAFPCALTRRFHLCANFCYGFLTEIVSKVCTTKEVGRYIFVWWCFLFHFVTCPCVL